MKYDTVEETKAIRLFLIQKKSVLKLTGIAKEAGINACLLNDILSQRQATLSPGVLSKLIPVLEDIGYKRIYSAFDKTVKELADLVGISSSKITNCTRQQEAIRARQYLIIINEGKFKFGTRILGQKLGDRNHSTISQAKKRIIKYLETKDPYFFEFYPEIEQKFEINTQKVIADYYKNVR